MSISAIKDGIVIDHIPTEKLFEVVSLLGLEHFETPITIGNNFESSYLGKKGFIKLADAECAESTLNRIALLAPNVHINIIRNYKVVEKKIASLPTVVMGLVKCTNEKCITNHEPMNTRFTLSDDGDECYICDYCGRKIMKQKIELL